MKPLFVRGKHICPWYCCFTFDNIFRKLLQDPEKIVSKYIKSGDTVLDIGPGQGYFTIPMAKIVGVNGRIYAVDIQKKMLEVVRRKALKAKVAERIISKLIDGANFVLDTKVDFALAFWMVHEVPEINLFFKSIYNSMKHGGKLLIAEPYLHVSSKTVIKTLLIIQDVGFKLIERPKIFFSNALLFKKE